MVVVSKPNKNKGGNLRSYFLYKKASAGKDRLADASKKTSVRFHARKFFTFKLFYFL